MKTIKTVAILVAAVSLVACGDDGAKPPPPPSMTQAEIDRINQRLWNPQDLPVPKPREKKPGNF